jgi:hypothetical protein
MLMGGYRVRSGLRDVARGAGELEQVLKQKEQEKLTAQQNIQLAQYDAERIAGFNRIKDEVSKSVNEGDGSYTDEDGNFSDTKYNERWDKYIATPAKKFLTNKKAQHGVEVASITDRERDLVVTKDHWERESARKENLIYDENVKQWGNNKYNSFGELDRVVEIQVTALNSAHEGDRINDVATKEGHEARLKEMIRKEVTSYALQNPHALESKDGGQPTLVEEGNINNLNKIANRLGYDGDAFSPAEIAEVKKTHADNKAYNKRIAKENLTAFQQKNEKAFDLRFADPQQADLPSIAEIDNAYARDDIDQAAWKGYRKLMAEGPAEQDDDEALMKVNEIREEVRAGRKFYRDGFDEIRKYKDKLKSTTYKTKIDDLAELDTVPAHGKVYYDYVAKFQADTKISDDNFNPLGATVGERAYNGNKLNQVLDEFHKNNPDASMADWDKAWKSAKETIVKPEAEKWFWNWLWRYAYSPIGTPIPSKFPKAEEAKTELSEMSLEELKQARQQLLDKQ